MVRNTIPNNIYIGNRVLKFKLWPPERDFFIDRERRKNKLKNGINMTFMKETGEITGDVQ